MLQVGGEKELVDALKMLLGDENIRGVHQRAAKESFELMSKGVVHSVWNLVSQFVLQSVKHSL
jgi:hypothetical protein